MVIATQEQQDLWDVFMWMYQWDGFRSGINVHSCVIPDPDRRTSRTFSGDDHISKAAEWIRIQWEKEPDVPDNAGEEWSTTQ